MRTRLWIVLLVILLASAPLALSQSRDTGAITGKVTDDQRNPLPGVTVNLSSPSLMGVRATTTDANGEFRFPALPPGTYAVKAELQGFQTALREDVRVNTTLTLTVDLELRPMAMAEEVTVVAQTPTVDVKSTETASVTLSNEILRNIPYNQFTSDIVNLAPGVVNNVAYGASANTGIAYTIDGVNVADPEAGSAWVFMDHNAVEEAKVMGIALPAEYGNFTGVIFNLVTKSGGNAFSGHMELDFQGQAQDKPAKFWQAVNNQAYLDDFPTLTSPSSRLMDISGHLGGPIVKDRLWFYTGAQYYRSQNRPTGFPEDVDYKQPRWFGKLTAQATPTLNVMATVEVDTYNGLNRSPFGFNYPQLSPDTTVTQKSPEVVGNFSLTKILSPKTFIDLKGAYFTGYYYLDPENGMDINARYSVDENKLTANSYHYFYADRSRFQANASLTHYVENFIAGSHDFKFGAEVERSFVRNRYGYTGENHTFYNDYYGEPYLAYQYEGYDTNTYYTRLEGFFQDSWQVTKRLNVNVGVRLSQNWGQVKGVEGNVYTSTRLAPRLGFSFDLLGDKTTVLKAQYGQFTEAMLSGIHSSMNPASAYRDYISLAWDGEKWVEFDRVVHEQLFHMDPDIKHPYVNQFTVSLERELFRDASFSVTYIHRDWKNLIGIVDRAADYTPVEYAVSELGQTFTIYERTNATMGVYDYLICNLSQDKSPWILEKPYRKYDGVEVLFNKRFSNRWQLLASYVYGRAWGSLNNNFGGDIGGAGNTFDPNFWTNAEGNSQFDPTHMVKLQGSYVIPWIEVSLNGYFRAITGNSWTAQARTPLYNQGRITFFCEPRGSNHFPLQKILDVRLEKILNIASRYRLGLIADIFNVFNAGTVTNWGTTYGRDWKPSQWASTSGHQLYAITQPRQARVGVRLIF